MGASFSRFEISSFLGLSALLSSRCCSICLYFRADPACISLISFSTDSLCLLISFFKLLSLSIPSAADTCSLFGLSASLPGLASLTLYNNLSWILSFKLENAL